MQAREGLQKPRQGVEVAAGSKHWVPEDTPGYPGLGKSGWGRKFWETAPNLKHDCLNFLRGSWGLDGKGGVEEKIMRLPPGGPQHLPHSRQTSMAPEPGRKQEVGTSHGGAGQRRDGGSDAGARGGPAVGTDTPARGAVAVPLRTYTPAGPRQGCGGPTGPVKPRPVTQREGKAGLSGRLGPLPGRGSPARPARLLLPPGPGSPGACGSRGVSGTHVTDPTAPRTPAPPPRPSSAPIPGAPLGAL